MGRRQIPFLPPLLPLILNIKNRKLDGLLHKLESGSVDPPQLSQFMFFAKARLQSFRKEVDVIACTAREFAITCCSAHSSIMA
jgi:hypothetical protein